MICCGNLFSRVFRIISKRSLNNIIFNELYKVRRYKRGNQNPYIEEQPTEKGQKDKQRSIKHTHKTKEQKREPHKKPGVNSGALKGYAVPVPIVAPVVLI